MKCSTLSMHPKQCTRTSAIMIQAERTGSVAEAALTAALI
jgi:hypothetical protein